jgi:hypothetical protein
MNNNNTKKNTILDIINSNNKKNTTTNTITNTIPNTITNTPITTTANISQSNNNAIENCKKLLAKSPMMAMFSVKDMYVGSLALVLPWFVLLMIVGFIIII